MGPVEVLAFIIVFILPCGIATAYVLNRRGRSSCLGFAIGFLFGPLGLIIALLMRPSVEHEAKRRLEIEQEVERRMGGKP